MQPESYDLSTVSKARGQRGSLEQLEDGRWQARYRESGRKGKRPQKTFAKNEKQKAVEWLRAGLNEATEIADGNTAILTRRREAGRTVTTTLDDFLAAYDAEPQTQNRIRVQLDVARRAFGPRLLTSLEPYELQAWRKTISPGWRSDVFQAFRQVLKQAVAWHWIETNPTDGIPNPQRKRPEVTPLPWQHALLLSDEITRIYRAVPIVGCGTGLRPEEWLALERRDVDLDAMVIHVRRVYSSGRLVELGPEGAKTRLQRRRVPIRQAVAEALEELVPRRIDTPLLFPGQRRNKTGNWLLGLTSFRERVWRPTFAAAGLPYQRPYDMRHTYASEAIAAGINLFDLSRFMGTSLKEIDETYGHLVADSEDRGRALLDAYDSRRERVARIGG
jgi:integrase